MNTKENNLMFRKQNRPNQHQRLSQDDDSELFWQISPVNNSINVEQFILNNFYLWK